MVNQSVSRIVVSIIGNVVSFAVFLSPIPTFYKIMKKKNVEEFSCDPYTASALNCALYIFYGMPFVNPNSLFTVTINAVGLVLEFVYLTIFFIYANEKGRKKLVIWLLAEAVCFVVFVLIIMLALDESLKRSDIVNVACDLLNIWMYVAPLTIMKKVITTKSVKYMPFWLSLTRFFNGICSTVYTLLYPLDPFALVSNGVGAISGAAQLILYGYYCYKGENQIDDPAPVVIANV